MNNHHRQGRTKDSSPRNTRRTICSFGKTWNAIQIEERLLRWCRSVQPLAFSVLGVRREYIRKRAEHDSLQMLRRSRTGSTMFLLKPETTKTKKGLKVSIYCIMHHGKSWSHASWHRYICIVTLTLFENCRSWLSSVPTLLRKAWLFREIPWCSVEVHQEGENQKTKRGKKLKINKQKLSALERCKLNVSPVIVFTEGRIVHSKARLTIGRAAAEIPC